MGFNSAFKGLKLRCDILWPSFLYHCAQPRTTLAVVIKDTVDKPAFFCLRAGNRGRVISKVSFSVLLLSCCLIWIQIRRVRPCTRSTDIFIANILQYKWNTNMKNEICGTWVVFLCQRYFLYTFFQKKETDICLWSSYSVCVCTCAYVHVTLFHSNVRTSWLICAKKNWYER